MDGTVLCSKASWDFHSNKNKKRQIRSGCRKNTSGRKRGGEGVQPKAGAGAAWRENRKGELAWPGVTGQGGKAHREEPKKMETAAPWCLRLKSGLFVILLGAWLVFICRQNQVALTRSLILLHLLGSFEPRWWPTMPVRHTILGTGPGLHTHTCTHSKHIALLCFFFSLFFPRR